MSEMTTETSTEMEDSAVETGVQEVQEVSAEPTLEEKIESLGQEGSEGDVEATAQAEGEAGEAPAYEPNYKYTVKDKEYEVDEWLRAAIKDPDTEAKAKELYERAMGLDEVKAHRDEIRADRDNFKAQYETQTQTLTHLNEMLNQGDFGAFFKAIDIPTEAILKYALEQAQLQEMGPEERAAYDNQWNAKRHARTLEEQYANQQATINHLQQQQVLSEYNHLMSTPDIKQYQEAFDQRNGENAFANEVALRGEYYERMGRSDISVKEVVGELMNKFALSSDPAQPATPAGVQATGVQAPKELPVIPNTGSGGSTVPAQRNIKSLDDLKKIANEL